jgi:hypothetical protein
MVLSDRDITVPEADTGDVMHRSRKVPSSSLSDRLDALRARSDAVR